MIGFMIYDFIFHNAESSNQLRATLGTPSALQARPSINRGTVPKPQLSLCTHGVVGAYGFSLLDFGCWWPMANG